MIDADPSGIPTRVVCILVGPGDMDSPLVANGEWRHFLGLTDFASALALLR